MSGASLLWPAGAVLGEGPVWDEALQRLWWMDIEGRRLHRMDAEGGDRRSWDLPARIGVLALTATPGRLLLGLQSGLAWFTAEEGAVTPLPEGRPWPADHRPNDGVVDTAGRFWFGTLQVEEPRPPVGALWRRAADGHIEHLEKGYRAPNGPALSADGARLVNTDSPDCGLYAFAVDAAPLVRRHFARMEVPGAVPDGMAWDAEGGLWVAANGGGCVVRFDAAGQETARLALPARQVSAVAFGGPGLRTLFATTAGGAGCAGEGPDGAVLALDPGVAGLAPRRLA